MLARAGEIVWTGEVAELGSGAAPGAAEGELYVHLLAATPEERRVVIEDLRPAGWARLRIAA